MASRLPSLGGRLLLGLVLAASAARAVIFSNDFSNAVHGSPMMLKWKVGDPKMYPLFIQGTVVSRSGDNGEVNVFKTNLTVDVTGDSFEWKNVPYPLRYSPGAEYELVVRPQNWDVATQGTPPVIATSEFFAVAPSAGEGPPSTAIPKPSLQPAPADTPSAGSPGKTTLIAAICVGIGIPILIGVGVAVWCVRRRREAAYEEKRRRRRFEMNIH